MNIDAQSSSLSSVERTVRALDSLADGPASLAQIVRATRLSSATALRYLNSLRDHGLVERGSDGRWRLGLRLFQYGQRALGDREPRSVVLPAMRQLFDLYGETVNFAMRIGEDLVIVETLESRHSIRHGSRLGERDQWHSSALGKAILAHLSADDVRALLARHGCTRRTDRTLTSVAAVEEDLRAIRERGFALDDEESDAGASCAGAVVLDRDGRPLGALSVSAPTSRLGETDLLQVGETVGSVAAMASETLGFRSAPVGAHVAGR